MLTDMSTAIGYVPLPPWDTADRLAKSLRHSKVSVQQMADYLGVHRNSVSAWINGRTPANERTLKLWSERTGWPLRWLRDGDEPGDPPPPSSFVPRQQKEPVRQLRAVHTEEEELSITEDALAYLRLAGEDLLLPRLDSNQQPFGEGLEAA